MLETQSGHASAGNRIQARAGDPCRVQMAVSIEAHGAHRISTLGSPCPKVWTGKQAFQISQPTGLLLS